MRMEKGGRRGRRGGREGKGKKKRKYIVNSNVEISRNRRVRRFSIDDR